MPNWCTSKLSIYGKDVPAFLERLQESRTIETYYSILHTFYPTPEVLMGIVTGFCKIGDEPVHRWRLLDDGTSVAITDEELQQLLEEHGATDWYEWQNIHWGCKWGDCDTKLIEQDDNHLVFEADWPWAPGINGLTEVAKLWPGLRFYLRYEEPGMGFQGWAKWWDGQLVDEYTWDYREFSPEYEEELYAEER